MKKILFFLFFFNLGFCSSLVFTGKQYITKEVLDVGENASIYVIDFDHDNKKDLMLGNKEGYILFYKNIGTDYNPSFENGKRITVDTGEIKLEGGYSSPIVCQWDGTKDLDLLIGDGGGNVWLAKAMNEVIEGMPPTYTVLEKLKADNKSIYLPNASLYAFDVDEDGLLDLLVGDEAGYVWFFRNIGRPDSPILSAGTKTLAGSQTLDVSQNAKPVMIDWNDDGKKDLIVGDIFGNIHIFTSGTQTGTGTFIPNFIFKEKAKVANKEIDVGFYGSPFICNWNNEGGYDMLGGAGDGTIYLFLNTKYQASEPPEFNTIQKIDGDPEFIDIGEYSKPQVIDWNNDGKKDLVTGDSLGKVRLFLNSGNDNSPIFTDGFFFSMTSGTQTEDLDVGYNSAPYPIDWNNDGKKDLVVGDKYGNINVFININTDDAPIFQRGTYATSYTLGYNATPCILDWDNDGKKDIIAGCQSGEIRLFLNIGSDISPVFAAPTTMQIPLDEEKDTSPTVIDWNRDYKKDIIIGTGYGEMYLFINLGSDKIPVFNTKERIKFSDGNDIRADNNSSPAISDWDNNGSSDLMVGSGDGTIFVCLSSILNLAPSVVVNTPQGTQSGNINISYTLRDDDSDTLSIDVKFSKDNITWVDATSQDGGDGKLCLSSSQIGVSHIFVWDSYADLGQGIYNIVLQITPSDGTNQGQAYKTSPFSVDNTTKTNLIPITIQGKNIDIGAYSTPCVSDWNNDYKKDLLVGDEFGYVYLFLNSGTDENPVFTSYSRLQARESTSTLVMKDLKVEGFSVPFVWDYDNDGSKDLLVGDRFGYVYYFKNIGGILEKGVRIQGGSDLDVGNMASPIVIDYNLDGKKDLVVGDEYGYIRLYLNYGTDMNPSFATGTKLLLGTGNTEIQVSYNSTPAFIDYNNNKKADLIAGDRNGNLWLFLNYGSDQLPLYDYGRILSSPSVSGNASCFISDWDNDGRKDFVLGNRNGSVYLYLLKEETNTPPSCVLFPVTIAVSTIAVKYKLYDIDGDTLSIIPEYSLDGVNYSSASGGTKENLIGSSFGVDYEFIWDSFVDLPETKTLVYFRITPKDKAVGTGFVVSFLLDNLNRQPIVKNISLSSNSGLIEVSFELEDSDYDTISLSFDYLLNGTWTKATTYGSLSFTPGICKLYWASSLDFPETETTLTMKITPYDSWGIGIFQTKTIKIENSRFSSKEVGTTSIGLPITFSPTTLILKSIEYPLVITIEDVLIPSSIPGLSDTGRKITAIRKDRPDVLIDSLSAKLTIPYNNEFSDEIERSLVIYQENSPLSSSVDTGSNTVSAEILSTGVYRIDALFKTFEVKVWPNPCKGNNITFSGISSGKIRIFTLTGELVKEIIESPYQWDTKNMDGKSVASGIYIWLSEKQKGILAIIR
ncbi:MAG: VCBS repeat-containing protein [bacterium]